MRKLFLLLTFLLFLPFVAKAQALKDCVIVSAASNNATTCTASNTRFWGVQITNTTATIYYLRLYNLAAAPTCSSATGFIRSIPLVPAGQQSQTVFMLP